MFKKYIPFACAKSLYEIDVQFYIQNNIKVLLMDLDNTLDSYKLYHPTDKAFKLIDLLRKNEIYPVIVSNNRGKRVKTYANDLKVEYINSATKPFGFRIKRFIKKHGWDNKQIMLVGDQMITDVCAGKNAKIKVVLTDKLVKEDQITTRFNRIFGNKIRKYHLKHKNLVDWREKYGKA